MAYTIKMKDGKDIELYTFDDIMYEFVDEDSNWRSVAFLNEIQRLNLVRSFMTYLNSIRREWTISQTIDFIEDHKSLKRWLDQNRP